MFARERYFKTINLKFELIFIIFLEAVEFKNPCNPSPCGPNSQCREINGQAVCSCVPGYMGSPPACRPECVVSSECALNKACVNQKCMDPCLGTCGVGAVCQVVNHNPICSCPPKYSGDPFIRCQPIRKFKIKYTFLISILEKVVFVQRK